MPREPSTQATMRRDARSTASHSRTLRVRWPTNVHISSGLRASQCLCCAFFRRSRANRGASSYAFYLLGNRVARHTRQAHDAAQRIAFQQQPVDLRVLPRFLDGGGLEIALMSAGFALVLGPPATNAVAAIRSLAYLAQTCCVQTM